jgi:hypothetical protein
MIKRLIIEKVIEGPLQFRDYEQFLLYYNKNKNINNMTKIEITDDNIIYNSISNLLDTIWSTVVPITNKQLKELERKLLINNITVGWSSLNEVLIDIFEDGIIDKSLLSLRYKMPDQNINKLINILNGIYKNVFKIRN